MPRPGLSQLLIDAAMNADTLRRLRETPGQVLEEYDLASEDREVLRSPDHRLLGLLGRAWREGQSNAAEVPSQPPHGPPLVIAPTLAPMLLALTVVPCVSADGGLRYAVWVNPMAEGAVPATLPPPPSATLPGAPLAPLYAVIELDGVKTSDAEGNPGVNLWAQFRQASNAAPIVEPTPADSQTVQRAASAVHASSPAERYDRLAELLRVLQENPQ